MRSTPWLVNHGQVQLDIRWQPVYLNFPPEEGKSWVVHNHWGKWTNSPWVNLIWIYQLKPFLRLRGDGLSKIKSQSANMRFWWLVLELAFSECLHGIYFLFAFWVLCIFLTFILVFVCVIFLSVEHTITINLYQSCYIVLRTCYLFYSFFPFFPYSSSSIDARSVYVLQAYVSVKTRVSFVKNVFLRWYKWHSNFTCLCLYIYLLTWFTALHSSLHPSPRDQHLTCCPLLAIPSYAVTATSEDLFMPRVSNSLGM